MPLIVSRYIRLYKEKSKEYKVIEATVTNVLQKLIKYLQIVPIYFKMYIGTLKGETVLISDKRKEYLKEYKKKMKKLVIDLRPDEKENLDKIVKIKNKSLVQWVRDHIQEDLKNM